MARWYECMSNRPPVYLVHGEESSQEEFKGYLERRNGAVVRRPRPGDVLDLNTL